jgi:lysylphosphatidylglycerol synthetase-like protein (DUF2156 family)
VTALISLFVLLAKGVIGARFHLFYFLSFAVASSIALCSLARYFKDDKRKWLLVIFVLLWGTHTAYTSSWKNWTYLVWDEQIFFRNLLFPLLLAFVFGVAAFLGSAARGRFGHYFVRLFLSLLLIFLFAHGPLVWGTLVYSDPDYVNNLFGLEGDEDAVTEFAVQRNRPAICDRLPEEFKDKCFSSLVNPK